VAQPGSRAAFLIVHAVLTASERSTRSRVAAVLNDALKWGHMREVAPHVTHGDWAALGRSCMLMFSDAVHRTLLRSAGARAVSGGIKATWPIDVCGLRIEGADSDHRRVRVGLQWNGFRGQAKPVSAGFETGGEKIALRAGLGRTWKA